MFCSQNRACWRISMIDMIDLEAADRQREKNHQEMMAVIGDTTEAIKKTVKYVETLEAAHRLLVQHLVHHGCACPGFSALRDLEL